MAKIVPGIITASGKVNDKVFVNSRRYGQHIRKAPAAGSKKEEPAFKKVYRRTAGLNQLAGELNRIIKEEAGKFKSSRFYENLLSRFRKEPSDNRWLLLRQLEEMEINPRYTLKKLGIDQVYTDTMTDKIVLTINTTVLPDPGIHRANSFCYEVLLLQWMKGKKPAIVSKQFGEWVPLKKGLPQFEFVFDRKRKCVHWLVCVWKFLGVGEGAIGKWATMGLQIVKAGTVDKKEQLLLKESEEKNEVKLINTINKIVRVKAKNIS